MPMGSTPINRMVHQIWMMKLLRQRMVVIRTPLFQWWLEPQGMYIKWPEPKAVRTLPDLEPGCQCTVAKICEDFSVSFGEPQKCVQGVFFATLGKMRGSPILASTLRLPTPTTSPLKPAPSPKNSKRGIQRILLLLFFSPSATQQTENTIQNNKQTK